MKRTNLYFQTLERERGASGGDIDVEFSPSGRVVGLWLNGHDYSANGEVVEAIVQLIGSSTIQRLLSERAEKE